MCGIGGFLLACPDWSAERLSITAQAMAGTLRHRGPDDSGVWVDPSAGVGLGHRRLSIVDLSAAGHQPMVSVDGRWVLVYNGELYNSDELRAPLKRAGVPFRGSSDTEVLLAAIARYGPRSALERTNGMFALAAWDRSERVLWLGRDRLGEKPLYCGWQAGAFLFGSEIKALRAHPAFAGQIDRAALSAYLQHKYVPSPRSIYQGIHKLPPGYLLTIDPTRPELPLAAEQYWSAADAAASGAFAAGCVPTTDELEALLADAVRRRMVADVPVGALLSGGIDSSAIVALMQKSSAHPVRTFTIGFHERGFDEAPYAAAIARHLGCEHTELYVTDTDAREVIPRLPDIYDEPFADSSQIPTFLVCEIASRSVSVALSGDGGDEAFGGYNRHVSLERMLRRVRRLPRSMRRTAGQALASVASERWSAAGRALVRVAPHSRLSDGRLGDRIIKVGRILLEDPEAAYAHLASFAGGRKLVLGERDEDETTIAGQSMGWPPPAHSLHTLTEQMMFADLIGYLPDDILVKVDRASMAVSLELRAPFLDHRVIEAAWRLPLDQKVSGGQGKIALRQVLHRHIPPALIKRPKTGFAMPLAAWLRGALRDWAETLFDERRLRADGYLDPAPIRAAWTEHLAGRGRWESQLWAVLMFQAWLERERTAAFAGIPTSSGANGHGTRCPSFRQLF